MSRVDLSDPELRRRGRGVQLLRLHFLIKHGPSTTNEMAEQLGANPDSLGRSLRRYARRGWVESELGVWRVRERGVARARWIYDRFVRRAVQDVTS